MSKLSKLIKMAEAVFNQGGEAALNDFMNTTTPEENKLLMTEALDGILSLLLTAALLDAKLEMEKRIPQKFSEN